MKLRKRVIALAVTAAIAATTIGVTAFAVSPTRIEWDSTNKRTFDVGDSYSLGYTFYPSNADEHMSLEWYSSDDYVATVDSSGTIYAHESGTARITARNERGVRNVWSISVRGDSSSSRSSRDDDYYYSSSRDEYDSSRDDYNLINSSSRSTASRTSIDTSREVSLTKTADRETVVNAVKNAGGSNARLDNYASVSVDTLKAAASAGKGAINFDTRSGKNLVARLQITPANASKLEGGTIKLGVYYKEKRTEALSDDYNSTYTNRVHVIKCDQANYGMTVKIFANVGTGVRASDLVFYSYDTSKRTHSKMSVSNVYVDSNGFVSFNTSYGGTILISEGGELSKY